MVLYDETAFYVWGLDLIARIVGSTQQYYHYDGLGSTRALTNGSGTTTATYNYDAFGAIKSQTGSGTNNFLFTGEWRDPETGFYFLRARYYDPVVGRFINRDLINGTKTAPQSLNTYAYVANNPTNLVDPSGLYLVAPDFPVRKPQSSYQDCYVGSEDECVSGGGNPSGAAPVGSGVGRGPFMVGGGMGFRSFDAFKRYFGTAGVRFHWHHVVEQTPANVARFQPEIIHNTSNILRVTEEAHWKISGYYSSKPVEYGGLTVREFLSTQSLDAQRQFGLQVLRDFGVLP